MGGVHRHAHVVGVGQRHVRGDLASGRVEYLAVVAAAAGPFAAGDVVVQLSGHGGISGVSMSPGLATVLVGAGLAGYRRGGYVCVQPVANDPSASTVAGKTGSYTGAASASAAGVYASPSASATAR